MDKMAKIELKHADVNSGNYQTIYASTVRLDGKTNTNSSPDASSHEAIEVNKISVENIKYVVAGFKLTGNFTYQDLLTIYRARFDGTNPAYLKVTYDTGTSLTAMDGTTTDIPVVLDNFTLDFDSTDSNNASLPKGELVFVETKVSGA